MGIVSKYLTGSTGAMNRFNSDDDKWRAVLARDKTADGAFFYGVVTTGVYCRPSCGARQPRRENVAFFRTQAEAEKAGYRACKRCRPDETPSWTRKQDVVASACRFIEQAETPPKLEDIAATVGLSPYHFHRLFKEVTGITPKAYATSHRTQAVKGGLKQSETVTQAIFSAGYNANSRFYEKAPGFLGMTPQEYRAGGAGQTIRYVIRECSLGLMLLAATGKGVCSILLGDDAGALELMLQQEFPGAVLAAKDAMMELWVDAALALIETGRRADKELPLDIQGTAFQQKVWKALQQIPAGTTASYKEIAERIRAPKAVRAVAQACAGNKIAVAIPCHRVVRSDGALSGYRWGVERKRSLLEREQNLQEEKPAREKLAGENQ